MATQRVAVNISSAGDNTVIMGRDGKSFKITRLVLSLAAEATVQFKSNARALSGPQTMLSMVLDEAAEPWYIGDQSAAFVISLGAGVQCGGTIWFEYI